MSVKADYFLDITEDVCPMTFVKTRLLIERMAPGEVAEILLKGSEPLKNVPESVSELGHEVLSLSPCPRDEEPAGTDADAAVYLLVVEKASK